MRRILLVAGLALALPLAAAAEERRPQMTVQGVGQVSVSPDIATVSVGVVAEARTADAALAANTELMTGVFETLGAAGIEPEDIRTTAISLAPKWHYPGSGEERIQRIVGFTANNAVEIRVRDLARLGEVLDSVVRSGANRVNAIRFGLDDPTAAEDEARRAAVADALRKARLYAEAAGVTLGRVMEIAETGMHQPGPRPMFEAAMARDAAPVPVAEGELTVRADVSVLFALKGQGAE